MSTTTLSDQAAAIAACSVLASRFGHLPAADVQISTVVAPHAITQGVSVHVHDALEAFEAWREALDITPDSLGFQQLVTCVSLSGWAFVNGIPVRLVGYGDRLHTPAAAVA
ncbi:hypothetical protein [Streptomyces lasiicapitis]|uniref:hypothetical protein n=1 Tax=Streptomyces lasiicapitis TaxID=1923961 RepID=UPI0036B77CE3